MNSIRMQVLSAGWRVPGECLRRGCAVKRSTNLRVALLVAWAAWDYAWDYVEERRIERLERTLCSRMIESHTRLLRTVLGVWGR